MPDTAEKHNPKEITSIDDVVHVRDLTDAHQNPNIPRSVFVDTLSDAVVEDEDYVSYVSGQSKPGKDFTSKSISLPARQMKHAFDADGVSGNAGDYLVYFNRTWHVVRKEDI